MDKKILGAFCINLFAAVASILSSKAGLGLFSIWPLFILFLIFLSDYELGVLSFVLSFGYEAPVIFIPSLGQAAIIRQDELMFTAIFLAWLLKRRMIFQKKGPLPLAKPLLFYLGLIIVSLVFRYDVISITPFMQTSVVGIISLLPLVLELFEVIFGYFILSDSRLSQDTRVRLFWSLPLAIGFALILSFFFSRGILPGNFITESFYDPTSTHFVRLSFFGNTSAWGVLLSVYFFILLFCFFYFRTFISKALLFFMLSLCIYAIFLSGTKTAMVGVLLAMGFLILKERKKLVINTGVIVFSLVAILASFFLVNKFASVEQKEEIEKQLEYAYVGSGAEGLDKAYSETSLGERLENWPRFASAVEEEPILLLFGRGWQRRALYETGVGLHNDLLTAVHDLGIGGGIFIFWLYWAMFFQFSAKRFNKILPSSQRGYLLLSFMPALVFFLLLSSFTSENFTFYWGIEVQFPLIITVMAVSWSYLKSIEPEEKDAFLQKENLH